MPPRSVEQGFETLEARTSELHAKEKSFLEKLREKGNNWIAMVGFTLLSSALAEGAFMREARADENTKVKDQIVELSARAEVRPLSDIDESVGHLTNLDEIQDGKGKKIAAIEEIMPAKVSPRSVSRIGHTIDLSEVNLSAGLDLAEKKSEFLLTFHFNES